MDMRDLNAFAAVARRRSFRGAAQELGVSVSTLSVRLRDLETLLGVRLLNRTTRSVAPTAAGERLLARVEPALAGQNSSDPVQFERQGYFCRDKDSTPGRPVFNRTVGLRDTWAKVSAGE